MYKIQADESWDRLVQKSIGDSQIGRCKLVIMGLWVIAATPEADANADSYSTCLNQFTPLPIKKSKTVISIETRNRVG